MWWQATPCRGDQLPHDHAPEPSSVVERPASSDAARRANPPPPRPRAAACGAQRHRCCNKNGIIPRDVVEDLVLSLPTGPVQVHQGSRSHSEGRWWQLQASVRLYGGGDVDRQKTPWCEETSNLYVFGTFSVPGVNGGQTIQKSECKTSSPTHPAPRPDTEHSHSSQAAPWAQLTITLCTEVVELYATTGTGAGPVSHLPCQTHHDAVWLLHIAADLDLLGRRGRPRTNILWTPTV